MTPAELQRLTQSHPALQNAPPTSEPETLRQAVEAACEANPTDTQLSKLLLLTQALCTATSAKPERVHGVRLESLIRWDSWTCTWLGTEMATGQAYLLRLILPEQQGIPLYRRSLRREFQLLTPLYDAAKLIEDDTWALILPLRGDPFTDCQTPLPFRHAIPLMGSALIGLEQWAKADIMPPPPSSQELREEQGHLKIYCLSPLAGDSLPAALAGLCDNLQSSCSGSPIEEFVTSLKEFPNDQFQEVSKRWRSFLAEALSIKRHTIAVKWRAEQVSTRASRLNNSVIRLIEACAAPTGKGVLGVDLNGQTLIIESNQGHIYWGSSEERNLILSPEDELSPSQARRVLRARASASLNNRLHTEHQADPAFTEAICSWLSSSMRLRAVRLLLRASFKKVA